MRPREAAFRRSLPFVYAGLALLFMPIAGAETFTVTEQTDDNGECEVDDCTLREAVIAANTLPGPDVIQLPGGSYQLSIPGPLDNAALTGDLDILDELEIRGDENQPTIVIGDGSDRVFNILSTTVEISNLTITGGESFSSGGGLRAEVSQVTIVDSTITGNSTGVDGGGLFLAIGNFQVINTTVTDNTAGSDGFGGGIYSFGIISNPANVTLINSTVSGNVARSGGGVFGMADSNVTILHSTIAGNTATFRGDVFANQFSPAPSFVNSLFVGECAILSQEPVSNGGNVESPGDTCQLMNPGDRHSVPDPGIGPLADNGGPTMTHALLPASPAVDTAVDAGCTTTDQRGQGRPVDGDFDGVAACDVGAYELSPAPVAIPALGRFGLAGFVVLLVGSALTIFRARQ